MLCKHPFIRDPQGALRWSKSMTPEERLAGTPFPCGVCIGCRVNNARVWAHRIMLESYMHERSAFLTLTFDEDHIPDNLSVEKEFAQRFIKRLRVNFVRYTSMKDYKFRYYIVGEYGDRSMRPHYHLAWFGSDFKNFYDLDCLKRAWPFGFYSVSGIGLQSARYLAGYIVKRFTKAGDPRLKGRGPEFSLMSRRPGLGVTFVNEVIAEFSKRRKDGTYYDSLINRFRIGGKSMPLGTFLRKKIIDGLGIESQNAFALENYQNDLEEKYFLSRYPYLDLIEDSRVAINNLEVNSKNISAKGRYL